MKILREAIDTSVRANAKELQKFGFVFSGILIGLFFVAIPWLNHRGHGPMPVLYVGLLLAAMAFIYPRALRPVFLIASVVGTVLGAINNRILLSLIFFGVLFPMAMLMRLVSKSDAMGKKFDKNQESYRTNCVGRDLIRNKEKAF